MPYRLTKSESVPQGIIRIVRDQIGRAVRELTDPALDRHEAVHQVRKRFKKVRAALRLVRAELGETYAGENAWFRDSARTLSQVRDAEALIETLEALRERFGEELDAAGFSTVRQALVERRERIAREEAGLEDRIVQLVRDLRSARRRAARWPLAADGFGALDEGLGLTYRRGRRALARAYEDPTLENFHEWRKRVKYHWYHIRLLRCVWPPVMDGYRTAVRRLADLVGQIHDLDVLRQTLLGEPECFGAGTRLKPLLKLVDRRQAELEAEARPLGRRVFAEKPADFLRRIGRYWEAWQEEG